MGVVISFSNEDVWLVARWAFRRLFSDIQDKFSVDPEIQYTFEKADAFGMLDVESLEKNKCKILDMMKSTVIELIDDKNELYRKNLDKEGYRMYREALPELLKYIKNYEGKNENQVSD